MEGPFSRKIHQRKPVDPAALAIEGLAFIAADQQHLDRFLALSGLAPGEIRQAAAAPGFLAAVLEFIGESDAMTLAFAQAAGVSPEMVAQARERLAGPPSWQED